MRVKDIPQIEKLSVSEKILLVEDIWDNISSEESAIPVPRATQKSWTEDLQGTDPVLVNFYLWMNFGQELT